MGRFEFDTLYVLYCWLLSLTENSLIGKHALKCLSYNTLFKGISSSGKVQFESMDYMNVSFGDVLFVVCTYISV